MQVQTPNSLRDLAFQLCFSEASASGNKKPGVERRAKPPHFSGFARCSISFYPVLVENPTIGSTSCLLLFLPWEDFLRSDRDALEQSTAPQIPWTTCNDTSFFLSVKPRSQLFFAFSSAPVYGVEKPFCSLLDPPRPSVYILQITQGDETRISGTIPATLSDFKIEPPSLLTVPVRNEMPVRVEITWRKEK